MMTRGRSELALAVQLARPSRMHSKASSDIIHKIYKTVCYIGFVYVKFYIHMYMKFHTHIPCITIKNFTILLEWSVPRQSCYDAQWDVWGSMWGVLLTTCKQSDYRWSNVCGNKQNLQTSMVMSSLHIHINSIYKYPGLHTVEHIWQFSNYIHIWEIWTH